MNISKLYRVLVLGGSVLTMGACGFDAHSEGSRIPADQSPASGTGTSSSGGGQGAQHDAGGTVDAGAADAGSDAGVAVADAGSSDADAGGVGSWLSWF